MTTREKAQKLLDALPDSELEPIVEIMAARSESKRGTAAGRDPDEAWGEPEMVGLPESWKTLPSGAPAPNWVAGLDAVRQGADGRRSSLSSRA